MRALNRKLLRDVLHLRGQVVAITLVVGCGIASFVAMRSTYESLQASQVHYYDSYRFANIFAQLKRAPDSISTRISEIPGVASAQFRIVSDVTLDVPGLDEPAKGRVVSIPDERVAMLNDLFITEGRYIESAKTNEILVSDAFANANQLKPGNTISAVINGRWQKLQIVGLALSPEYVYEIRSGEIFPDNRRSGVLWMSQSALGPALDMKGGFNDVALSLGPGAVEAEVIHQLDVLLENYGGLGAYGRDIQVSNHFLSNELAELQVTGTFIPAIFLLTTGFLIHLVLSRLVTTQRQEIAVLKAFGYDNYSLAFHYLKLAFLVIVAGVALGVATGWYLGSKITALYLQFFHFPVFRYEAGPKVLGVSIFISLGTASLGALGAVRRVVMLPPAESMRPEPPARFKVNIFERLGLHRLIPTALRITVRNLERRPGKAILAIFGTSLAAALLVVGFFLYLDTVRRIIDIQFKEVQREDVSVVFHEPRPADVKFDLASLPGVLRVEPYRTVSAQLHYLNRKRRCVVTGLEPSTELRRILDRNSRVFTPPQEGLILSSGLAQLIGVQPGDFVRLEVLEGIRPTREIEVIALLDDLVGLSVYMDKRSLHRLMNESEVSSGAFMMVDWSSISQLYTQLKQTPAVSAVSAPETAQASFEKTIGRTLDVSTAILIAFAVTICLGMVYNGARIALSERGHELASLRVLGFTRTEIGLMLLGEQAILTCLAIPVGYALGYVLAGLITVVVDTEIIRFPLLISPRTYALTFLIMASSFVVSALLISWRLRNLDLIEVLKTRE